LVPDFDGGPVVVQTGFDADMPIGPRPATTISNELPDACPPKALALPLIYRDFGTSYWQLAD
jgi:hypothetical protein